MLILLAQFPTRCPSRSRQPSPVAMQVVTAEDGCETLEQSYLVSCLKIKRPPSRCVVFENEPQGVVAAHDAMTKVVAIIGNHPGYAFRHADMRIGSLEELSLMSLREVFRDEGPR